MTSSVGLGPLSSQIYQARAFLARHEAWQPSSYRKTFHSWDNVWAMLGASLQLASGVEAVTKNYFCVLPNMPNWFCPHLLCRCWLVGWG